MEALITGSSVEECVKKACKQYDVEEKNLKYEIVKNEKHFFKRVVEIRVLEVKTSEFVKEDNNVINEDNITVENNKIEDKKTSNNVCGAKVQNGNIIVKDFDDNVSVITIEPCDNVILWVNDKRCNFKTPVSESDKIVYEFVEEEAVRNVDIAVTTDKLEAYISVRYEAKNEYELIDCEYTNDLKLKIRKKGKKMPPKYTEKELKQILYDKGIRNGILEDELKLICEEDNVTEHLIAKGVPAVDDIPDQIKLYFSDTKELIDYDTNDTKVDYRNRYMISNVKAGEVVAELIPGKMGSNGTNVLGLEIKKKPCKTLNLKAGNNCIFKDNKVIANVEGKPAIKGNTISINQIYRCEEVDLKNGNIDFVGNVEISKNIDEGMEVIAGQEVTVGKNVESALLKAGGQITVLGNAISSNIKAGSENVEVKMQKDNLMEYKEYIKQILDSAEQLKDHNMFEQSRYGAIIKLLIENKFKNVIKLSKEILKYNAENDAKSSDVSEFIISKMTGLGPLKINDGQELLTFIDKLQMDIEELEAVAPNSSDVYVSYAQGSTIEASGNVFITGKGQYTSNITALNNIEFTDEKSVCRGGVLNAGNEIILKTVGSVAGVNTILKVPKDGRITANIAYSNTMFCFGEKQMLLEVSSKEVNAYIDKTGEIVIDKFVL